MSILFCLWNKRTGAGGEEIIKELLAWLLGFWEPRFPDTCLQNKWGREFLSPFIEQLMCYSAEMYGEWFNDPICFNKKWFLLIIWGLFLTYSLYTRIFQNKPPLVLRDVQQLGCCADCFFHFIINSRTSCSIKTVSMI